MSAGGDMYGGVGERFIQGNNMVIQKEGGRGRTKATGEAESLAVKGTAKMGDKAERVKAPGDAPASTKTKKAGKKQVKVMDPLRKTKIVGSIHSGS
jgi:hypothetical protein